MLRKIIVACVAVVAIATLAIPAEAAGRKKKVEDIGRHDPGLRTFFRGENWYWRGEGWTGVGLYPFGMFSDEGCWKNKHLGAPWRGVWVCR